MLSPLCDIFWLNQMSFEFQIFHSGSRGSGVNNYILITHYSLANVPFCWSCWICLFINRFLAIQPEARLYLMVCKLDSGINLEELVTDYCYLLETPFEKSAPTLFLIFMHMILWVLFTLWVKSLLSQADKLPRSSQLFPHWKSWDPRMCENAILTQLNPPKLYILTLTRRDWRMWHRARGTLYHGPPKTEPLCEVTFLTAEWKGKMSFGTTKVKSWAVILRSSQELSRHEMGCLFHLVFM